MTTKAVYIGGWGGSKNTAKGVAKALYEYHDEVEAFTASRADRNPHMVIDAAEGAAAYTHSDGLRVLRTTEADPECIQAFSPPSKMSYPKLAWRSVVKSLQMYWLNQRDQSLWTNGDAPTLYHLGMAAELAAHPIASVSQLHKLHGYDALAAEQAVPTVFIYGDRDVYAPVLDVRNHPSVVSGLAEVHFIPGVHDQLPLDPVKTLYAAKSVLTATL